MLRIASYASDMRILEQIRLVCQAQCVCVMRASCIVPHRAYGNIHKTIVCAMRNRRETTARTSRMFYSSFRDFVSVHSSSQGVELEIDFSGSGEKKELESVHGTLQSGLPRQDADV